MTRHDQYVALTAAQGSAHTALDLLEIISVTYSYGADENRGLGHRSCSGGYEVAEVVHDHLKAVVDALAQVTAAMEARS